MLAAPNQQETTLMPNKMNKIARWQIMKAVPTSNQPIFNTNNFSSGPKDLRKTAKLKYLLP